ncbi:NEDD8-activating enzyme E1 regulatory subunit AXR1-like protein [Tanacetum coccineum]|uniref:NEDD8-activating enzyme E1 regulatory subunit AXR1-like protein n=1 Tax=Tanacetum coccineum TaxID=301880 RepID=A0ABQ5DC02_9ASTR
MATTLPPSTTPLRSDHRLLHSATIPTASGKSYPFTFVPLEFLIETKDDDDDDDDDEISNYVDLHMYMLGGGWKWQDLQGLLWWIIIEVCLQQNENSVMTNGKSNIHSLERAYIEEELQLEKEKSPKDAYLVRYADIGKEFNSPFLPEMQKYLTDEDVVVRLYILLRAVDGLGANYNTFPGQFDGDMDKEIFILKTTVVGLLSDLGCNDSTLTEDLINEMCRYDAAELHAVAAYVGGVASQEIIKVKNSYFRLSLVFTSHVPEQFPTLSKMFCIIGWEDNSLITKQFVPMTGTLIFNGIDHKSQLLSL